VYCFCPKGCHSDEPLTSFVLACKVENNWPFASTCRTHKFEPDGGPVGFTCRCKPSKTPKVPESEVGLLAQSALELQEKGLVAIICSASSDCPDNTSCEDGFCKGGRP
jgi:hypothetical protein